MYSASEIVNNTGFSTVVLVLTLGIVFSLIRPGSSGGRGGSIISAGWFKELYKKHTFLSIFALTFACPFVAITISSLNPLPVDIYWPARQLYFILNSLWCLVIMYWFYNPLFKESMYNAYHLKKNKVIGARGYWNFGNLGSNKNNKKYLLNYLTVGVLIPIVFGLVSFATVYLYQYFPFNMPLFIVRAIFG